MCQHTDPGMTLKHIYFGPFGSGRYSWLGGGGADGPQHGLELVVPAPAAGLQLLLEGPGLESPQDLHIGAFVLAVAPGVRTEA